MLSETTYDVQYVVGDGALGHKSIVHRNRLKGVCSQAQKDILAEAQQRQEAALAGTLGASDEPASAPTTKAKGLVVDKGTPTSGAQEAAACWTATNTHPGVESKREHLRKQTREILRRRNPTLSGTGPSSTSDPMKKTTPAIGQRSGGAKVAPACEGHSAQAVASRRLIRQQAAGEPRNNDAWMVAGNEVVQWVNRLDAMEEKIKKREVNLKKMRAHLAAAGRCMVDFTNPVEWHEQMIVELPWPVRHGRALRDRQVAVNVQAQTLTQRLMSVTQQVVKSEAVMRQLEAERSALFASVEDRCLEKLESILEEYSACQLTYVSTRWALVRELVRKDGVSPALSRVNHRLEGAGLRLDFHFAPTRPSHGLPSSSRPSTNEHWWRVPEVESITILDSDSDEDGPAVVCHCKACKKREAAEAAEKTSTSAPASTTTTTSTAGTTTTTTSSAAGVSATVQTNVRGVKTKTDQ